VFRKIGESLSRQLSGPFFAVKLTVAIAIVFCVFAGTSDLFLSDLSILKGVRLVLGIVLGVFMLTVALEGQLFTKVNLPLRFLSFGGGLSLIDSRIPTDVIGLVILIQLLVYQRYLARREEAMRRLKTIPDEPENTTNPPLPSA
jgi:TRAP-type uncharacterized transport system fused permease subunit